MITRYALAILALALPLAASADTLVLKNGGKLDGVVVAERDGNVHFRTADGLAVYPKSQVAEIINGRTLIEEYAKRRHALVFTDAASHFALAQWCEKRGLWGERTDLLEQVVTIEPNHADARKALNHVNHGGKWLTSTTELREAGYVYYLGKLYSPEQAKDLKIDARKEAAHKKLESTVNKLMKQLASKEAKKRVSARDELLAISRKREMPKLAEVAGELYRRYSDAINGAAGSGAGRYTTTELRLTNATTEIDEIVTTLALGGTDIDGDDPTDDPDANVGEDDPTVIRIEVPRQRLIKLRTTVTIPAGRGR